MKIREIRAAGLRGATPEGGWDEELRRDDCVHTLIAVVTDEGLVGLGSAFTSDQLARAALALLEPLYRGENALEPERVSEKLHQNTFWLGRGGSVTRTISGIDIALWDLLGKATGQPVGRLLGGRYRDRVKPYASLLMQEHGVRFIPHGWNTAVGVAADLQLASAFADTDLVEYLTGSAYVDEIASGGWKLDAHGLLAIPDAPGLGLELDLEAVAKYTRGERLVP